MSLPRIGFSLPAFGPEASPAAICTIATTAEQLGFHAVSLSERLLLPATPDWTNDFGLPEYPLYDTLETLTWVAAKTTRIRLGTGILQSLLQSPVVLARRLATLDHFSGGRLEVGIGQGWMPQEFTAVGVPMSRRGAGFEEHLAAMRACWGPDPVEHSSSRYPIARARIGPKPLNGHLPVYVGGLAPQAVERAARIGDGFITALRDWDTCVAEVGAYRNAGGRGPVLLRGNPPFTGDRSPTTVVAAMSSMLVSARESGVDELHFDLTLAGFPIDEQVTIMTTLAETIGV